MAEPRTADHALLVVLHEAVDARTQEADSLAAVEHQPAAHQPQLAPTRNRLGRHVELLGQLFHREHLLADVLDLLLGRVGKILDEQMQVVQQILARNLRPGIGVRPIAGDPEADVFVGIDLLRIDLADQTLRDLNLLQTLVGRREPDLLIAKIAQNWAMVSSLHGTPLSLLLSSCARVVFLANPSPTCGLAVGARLRALS